jgi:hypothetical protein
MAFDLYSFEYLKSGSDRQQRAYSSLVELNPLVKLDRKHDAEFGLQPALVGSLPLDLALAESPIAISSFAADLKSYSQMLRTEFGALENFESARGIRLGVATLITRFSFAAELYEIFTQNVFVPQQHCVVQLLVEERLLLLGGISFRESILEKRLTGLSTELAFGAVLGLEDPDRELLELEDLSDVELRARFQEHF